MLLAWWVFQRTEVEMEQARFFMQHYLPELIKKVADFNASLVKSGRQDFVAIIPSADGLQISLRYGQLVELVFWSSDVFSATTRNKLKYFFDYVVATTLSAVEGVIPLTLERVLRAFPGGDEVCGARA